MKTARLATISISIASLLLAALGAATVAWVTARHVSADSTSAFDRDLAARRAVATAAYLATLDLEAIQRRGADYCSTRFDPERIGKPAHEIDKRNCDYDHERLAAVEAYLQDVDRLTVLRHIFHDVTRDAQTNTERHIALLKFLHRASYHCSKLRPMYPDCTRCWDPLVVLELNEMHCTHAARLAVDLWNAGGYHARCVGFGRKTSAEVYYDDDWHYFGADSCGGNGLVARDDDGTIPSWVDLSRNPGLLDVLPFRYELNRHGSPRTSGTLVRSHNCFFETGGEPQKYFWRDGPAEPGEFNYGWDRRVIIPGDWESREGEPRFHPGAVRFERVSIERSEQDAVHVATIEWQPAEDRDGDLLGYRVYVASHARGWNYQVFAGVGQAQPFWSSDQGWSPEMYDALYRMPPSDVAVMKVFAQIDHPSVQIEIPDGHERFITIMAFDAYGESIGKEMYLMSNELRIGATGNGHDRPHRISQSGLRAAMSRLVM